ncbi:MAG: F0F1 ATP synthase subunit delta, partial [Thermotoga sp.]
RVDKSILAGFKVRVEDHILDATLNGELSRISKVVLK